MFFSLRPCDARNNHQRRSRSERIVPKSQARLGCPCPAQSGIARHPQLPPQGIPPFTHVHGHTHLLPKRLGGGAHLTAPPHHTIPTLSVHPVPSNTRPVSSTPPTPQALQRRSTCTTQTDIAHDPRPVRATGTAAELRPLDSYGTPLRRACNVTARAPDPRAPALAPSPAATTAPHIHPLPPHRALPLPLHTPSPPPPPPLCGAAAWAHMKAPSAARYHYIPSGPSQEATRAPSSTATPQMVSLPPTRSSSIRLPRHS